MALKSIVIKVNSFPSVSETFIVSNIVAAIDKGYKVDIITKSKKSVIASSQEHLFKKYNLLKHTHSFKQPYKKYKRYLFGIYSLLQPVVLFYFFKYSKQNKGKRLEFLFKLQFYRRFRNSELFHVHFATAAEEIPYLKNIGFIKSKILVTFHGYDAYFQDDIQMRVLKAKYALLFETADVCTINTLYLKNKIEALGCPTTKIKIVPMGVDSSYYMPKSYPKSATSCNEIKLISVGRLIELKGHEFGIRAIKLLVDKGMSISYVVIGEGVLMNKLQTLINELELHKQVKLLGKGSQEEIRNALDQANLFLMTSVKDASGREEAQGVVTAEAQAMGLPVVGFNSGGVPYTVSDETGILVSQKNYVALAGAVELIMEDHGKYMNMSLAARQWVVENFDLNKMVDMYYEELV